MFRTKNIEIIGCSLGTAKHKGRNRPVIVTTFRLGENFIPLNVNITMDQAERLVEDLQGLLKQKAAPGVRERRDTRQQTREVIEKLAKKPE